MAGGPTFGGSISGQDGAGALARRIENIERDISEMKAARTLEAATIQQGGIQIVQGGTVKVVDANGNVTAIIGALPAAYNRSDGSPQPGLMFSRPDGTTALLLGDRNATVPPYSAAFQVIDRLGGRVVLSDDTNSGHGLATPHVLHSPLQDTNVTTWPSTTATSWTTIANGLAEMQNPKLQWQIALSADAGTTAQFRLMGNGTQLGTTQTVVGGGSGVITYWQPASVNMPAGVSIGDFLSLSLDAQRTAGTGSARAVCIWLSGMQS